MRALENMYEHNEDFQKFVAKNFGDNRFDVDTGVDLRSLVNIRKFY